MITLSSLTDILTTVFWGLVLLTSIVFIHEGGHYLAARAFGVRVKEFMIGLPGAKLAFKRKETYYGVTVVPLGGYCMIAGMEKGAAGTDLEKALAFISYFGTICLERAERAGESLDFDLLTHLNTLDDWGTVRRYRARGLYHYDIAEATIDGVRYEEGESRYIPDLKAFLASEHTRTYASLPWWKRIVILLAGSFSNLLVAMAILITLLMVNGTQAPTTTVDSVVPSSPAAVAGVLPGDEIVSLNAVPLQSWQDFTSAVQQYEAGDEVVLGYRHDGYKLTAVLTLAESEAGSPMIGVTSRIRHEPIDFFRAAEVSVSLVGLTLGAILQLLNPATFANTIGQTSSVVGISMEASSAAASGPFTFILLVAALSISIGLMNLLPIPPLDGGKIVIETIERVTRRRLPARVVNGLSFAGLAAMLLLFVVATNADIQRYFLGG
ncbi:MAG: site-2 protease family protein [Coriobacteriales bacterium]|jgi:regulator of sigma E protease|nr:site-2 protease family protein [Coriobacteriales bacterium]